MYDSSIAYAETRFGTLCQFCADDQYSDLEQLAWKRSSSVRITCSSCGQSNDHPLWSERSHQ